MQLFQASIKTVVLRFYLMMVVVCAALFLHIPLLALLAAPIFLSALLGIRIGAKAA
jgi:hypothetical protein